MTDEPKLILFTVEDYINANLVHSLHVSERKSFRGCRRRWHYVFQDMYYPLTTPKPLEFGIAYHKAAEHWYDPNTWGIDDSSREVETLQTFRNECMRQMHEYMQKQGIEHLSQLDPEVEKDYQERVALGQGMLKMMFKQSYELDRRYRPMGVEVKFEVPITYAGEQLWCKCNRCWKRWQEFTADKERSKDFHDFRQRGPWKGLPVTLGGRIDALFQDENERYWIVDWKTAARLALGVPGSPDDFLFMDDQITSYCWALWILKLDVAGFIYHEQKKAVPEEPEPLKRARLGALYSVSKSNNYEYKTYLATVMANDPSGYHNGAYDAFLEHLQESDDAYYKRHTIIRSTTELEQAGLNIALEALDMIDPGLRIYPNPGRFACGGCAFKEPCLGTNRGEDVLYTLETLFEKRNRLYWETAELSTDKTGS